MASYAHLKSPLVCWNARETISDRPGKIPAASHGGLWACVCDRAERWYHKGTELG